MSGFRAMNNDETIVQVKQETVDDNNQETLLFVDDEQNILTSLRRLFRSDGYRILLANSGAEGLSILEKENVDLVISDMRMPEMDGAEFLSYVAEKWPSVIRILLTGYSDVESTISAINKGNIYKYVSKPWDDNDLKITVNHALEHGRLIEERNRLFELSQQQNEQLKDLNDNLEQKVKSRTEEVQQTMDMLDLTYESLKQGYVSTVDVFSNLIEMRRPRVSGYSRDIAEYAKKLALKMDIGTDEVQNIHFAGLLHDIGKIGLSDELFSVAFDALNDEQRVEVMQHPIIGESVLMALEPLHEAATIIRSHRERYDGHGYPDKLQGTEIPIGARILAVADDYHSAQNGTLFTQHLTVSEVRDYISTNSGKRYDPKVLASFIELLNEIEEQAEDLNEKRIMSGSLCAGMMLSRDMITKKGVLLLSKGHLLDDPLIKKIQDFEITIGEDMNIYIFSQ